MGKFLLLVLALIFACNFTGKAQSSDEQLWNDANSFYERGNYSEAIRQYQLIEAYTKRPGILYNMGLAYHKTGQLGLAILSFEKAKKLDPNDEDIDHNLRLANQEIENPYSDNTFVLAKIWKSIANFVYPNIWAIIFLIVFTIAVYYFSVKVFLKKGKKIQLGLLSFVLILVLLLMIQSNRNVQEGDKGIATKMASQYFADETMEQAIERVIPEGTKVTIIQLNEDFAKIQLPNGVIAYVDQAFIKPI